MKHIFLITFLGLVSVFASESIEREVKICEFYNNTNPNKTGYCNGERISFKEFYKNGWKVDSGVAISDFRGNSSMIYVFSRPIEKDTKD